MEVRIAKKAEKELNRIPDPMAKKITFDLLALSHNPFPKNSKKLRGNQNYRLRIGVYRAVYWLNKKAKTIVVLRIKHRKDIYKG